MCTFVFHSTSKSMGLLFNFFMRHLRLHRWHHWLQMIISLCCVSNNATIKDSDDHLGINSLVQSLCSELTFHLWANWISHGDLLGVLCAAANVTSLTCLNKHGFTPFSLVVLILHAVKCHATSSDRYVTMNPIARYIRLMTGSISIVVKYRARLINKSRYQMLIVLIRPEIWDTVITNMDMTYNIDYRSNWLRCDNISKLLLIQEELSKISL